LICTCPGCFDILTDRPPSTLHVTKVEIGPTAIAVSIDVPTGDCHVNLCCLGDLHVFGVVLHMFSEIFRPLANDIVGNDNTEKCYAHQHRKDDEIDGTVSRLSMPVSE